MYVCIYVCMYVRTYVPNRPNSTFQSQLPLGVFASSLLPSVRLFVRFFVRLFVCRLLVSLSVFECWLAFGCLGLRRFDAWMIGLGYLEAGRGARLKVTFSHPSTSLPEGLFLIFVFRISYFVFLVSCFLFLVSCFGFLVSGFLSFFRSFFSSVLLPFLFIYLFIYLFFSLFIFLQDKKKATRFPRVE